MVSFSSFLKSDNLICLDFQGMEKKDERIFKIIMCGLVGLEKLEGEQIRSIIIFWWTIPLKEQNVMREHIECKLSMQYRLHYQITAFALSLSIPTLRCTHLEINLSKHKVANAQVWQAVLSGERLEWRHCLQ